VTISKISLLTPDEDKIWEDKSAKTVAFFCKSRPVVIDQRIREELVVVSKSRGDANVRICLHEGPEDDHHDMIVLEHSGRYGRPHKHLRKGEAFHIMEGRLAVFAFSDDGAVTDSVVLGPGDIYRIERNMYHGLLPITGYVIYHENKPGPFEGVGDSIYPDWAPDGSDETAAKAYSGQLTRYLEN